MTTKAAFNVEEWSAVTSAPALAALMVIAADRGGTLRESLAAQRATAEAVAGDPGELLRDILTTPTAIDVTGERPRSPDDLRDRAVTTLRQAVALLEQKATDEEVVEYKRFVYSLGEAVARAHREGGFLGLGGTEISEREQAALDQIAAVFDEVQSG
jgi:hypothetical protein